MSERKALGAMLVLAVTGHRPPKIKVGARDAYDTRVYGGLVQFALTQLEAAQPGLVITGMAQGWDTAIAHACAESGVPFVAAVPCDGQDSRWPAKARRKYRWLLGQAHEVRVVSPGPYRAWKMAERNRWMVREADVLMALWNGEQRGGTAGCVREAHQLGKTVLNVWDDWCAFTSTRGAA